MEVSRSLQSPWKAPGLHLPQLQGQPPRTQELGTKPESPQGSPHGCRRQLHARTPRGTVCAPETNTGNAQAHKQWGIEQGHVALGECHTRPGDGVKPEDTGPPRWSSQGLPSSLVAVITADRYLGRTDELYLGITEGQTGAQRG